MTRIRMSAVSAAVVAGALALGACGSDDSSSSSSSSGSNGKAYDGNPVSGQKKGGSLKMLTVEAFQHLDPGTAYFQLDYSVDFAVHRSLYYYKPDDPTHPQPDLAEGEPDVSPDGKTVTVKIKSGVKYGTNKKSAITGKEVTAADIKYAFERAYNPHVANGYIGIYFPLEGSKGAKGGEVSGIETPDDHTLVLHLTKPTGASAAKALVMPITMPVPKSYAESFDKKNPSGYDADPTKQAFTGPYMIQQYSPGKSLTLVRNPEWDAKSDALRPAYLDKITFQIGADANVAGRQVLDGQSIAQLDTPAAPAVKQFATRKPDQISFTPLGNRWVSLNYQKKPFSNLNVRKAAAAILDRTAMQRVRGGRSIGDIATHFLSPTVPGFDEAGGMAGPDVDYLKNPNGDPALAAKYMKAGGYPSGKANGESILMIGDNTSPAKEDALIVQNSLEKLGFKVRTRLVDHSVFYSKYCQQLDQLKKIDVCANFGWLPDFNDPYAMLNVNFNGEAIVPVNGNNPSLFDDKKINAAMDKGAEILDDADRAKAWGEIDRQLVEQVAAVPWLWDKQASITGSNVIGVIAKWNAEMDLAWVSLK